MKKNKYRITKFKDLCKILISYTIFFVILVLFIGLIFKVNDKEAIYNGLGGDGLTQHFVNLIYWRDLLINLIKTGKFSTFTWNIGLGMDLFSNLNYYIIGDIFSYISVLFPTKSIELLYSILIILRMYCVGLTFIAYCKHRKMNNYATLIGSLMYTFCSFVLFSAVRHPYFTNAVILFPLLMVGIEKIIIEDKKVFYTLILFITFLASFYFGYMTAIIIAIYGVILAIFTYRDRGIKKIVSVLLKTLCYSLIGILMASVTLIPTLIDFINSERSSYILQPYSIDYYRNLLTNLLTTSGSYWVYWGVQSIILISLPIFMKRRKNNYPLFWLMTILILPLLFASIGSIFCGFSFPNNRWVYVYSFIFSLITVAFFNEKKNINKKELNWIILLTSLYLVATYLFEKTISVYTAIQLAIFLIILLITLNKKALNGYQKNIANSLILIIFIFGIATSIYGIYVSDDYLSLFIEKNSVDELMATSRKTIDSFGTAIDHLNEIDNSYYRVSKYPLDYENLGLVSNYAALTHFYSITPQDYEMLSNDLDNSQYYVNFGLKEFDYRTKITTLLGVKYHITNKDVIVPYGYSLIEDYDDGTMIYQNDYATSFATLYTNYITIEDYENLSALEKESSLLKATALNEDTNKDDLDYLENYEFNNIEELSYTIKDVYELMDDNTITITDTEENYIEIEIDDIENKEVYISLENFKYSAYSRNGLIAIETTEGITKYDINRLKRQYRWYQPDYSYKISVKCNGYTNSKSPKDYLTSAHYYEYDRLLFNLGYHDTAKGTIKISLSKVGIYTFDAINVYVVSMDAYEDDIDALNRSNFLITSYGNGYLEGSVDAEETGVLQFSTFYSDGFTVYVDGKVVETLISNKYFLGIMIEKGYHTIYIDYHNEYIEYGLWGTTVGIVLFIILLIINKVKKKLRC